MKRKLVFVGLVFFVSLTLLQYHSMARVNKALNPIGLKQAEHSSLVKPVHYYSKEVNGTQVISVDGEKFICKKPTTKS